MAIALPAPVHLGIRIAQAICALVVIGTAGYVASWWASSWRYGSPGEINFMIFNGVWTLLVVAALIVIPMRFSSSAINHRFAILGIEALTTLFWFAGFVALAVWISGRVCYGTVCDSAKAAAVFGAFEWILFMITATFATIHAIRPNHSMKAANNGPVTTV